VVWILSDAVGRLEDVFSPADFSAQQTVTGLLLSYVMAMGVDASLVVEANKTAPTNMNLLSDEELTELRSMVTKEVRDGLELVNGSTSSSAPMTSAVL
jgi:hypothetical protein